MHVDCKVFSLCISYDYSKGSLGLHRLYASILQMKNWGSEVCVLLHIVQLTRDLRIHLHFSDSEFHVLIKEFPYHFACWLSEAGIPLLKSLVCFLWPQKGQSKSALRNCHFSVITLHTKLCTLSSSRWSVLSFGLPKPCLFLYTILISTGRQLSAAWTICVKTSC